MTDNLTTTPETNSDDLLKEIEVALTSKGYQFFVANKKEGVLDYLYQLIGVDKQVAVTDFTLERALQLKNTLKDKGVTILESSLSKREDLLEADIGITGADVVTSDTGSVFLVENNGYARLVSNMPGIHVVITGMESIVSDLHEGMLKVREISREKYQEPIANYVTVITGPSRTADIEFKMAFGMHGPKEVHFICCIWN